MFNRFHFNKHMIFDQQIRRVFPYRLSLIFHTYGVLLVNYKPLLL